MRTSARAAMAAAVSMATIVSLAGIARADEHNPVPSQQQVDQARQDVENKTKDVASLRASLVLANQELEDASTHAEMAAEAYNGAMWRLSVARQESVKAKREAAAARKRVADQRAGIAQLVTQSYQEGSQFNSMTAMLSDDGPQGIMNSYGAFQSADDSMQARYDRFTAASTLAKVYEAKAEKAKKHQARLADGAKKSRDEAQSFASAAATAANRIAAQKTQLINQLAKAQHVSIGLATQRQNALEAIARQKAEEAAQAKARAKARAEAKAAAAQAAAAQQANQNSHHASGGSGGAHSSGGSHGSGGSGGSGGGTATPPPSSHPPAPSGGVGAAIAYAKSQLGEPYRWGAAGPGSWDCSGLTMKAWAQGGKSLPHYSVAQYDAGTPISISSAKAGDLLFWSSNGRRSGIHHVALYLGGGQFIEAPHTGANVRYNSIYDWYPNFAVRL